jgi:hypothetical protein
MVIGERHEPEEIGRAGMTSVYITQWPRNPHHPAVAAAFYDGMRYSWEYMQPGVARRLAALLIQAADEIDPPRGGEG